MKRLHRVFASLGPDKITKLFKIGTEVNPGTSTGKETQTGQVAGAAAGEGIKGRNGYPL